VVDEPWTNRAGDLHVMTFQDGRPAEVGDWIVHCTEGEVYPVKDTVFTRKYRDRDALGPCVSPNLTFSLGSPPRWG
jgi:hypothetical protein